MEKSRLMELAGVQLNEENIVKLATTLSTNDIIDLCAEHIWHEMFQEGDVDEFFSDIKRELETKKDRTK